MRVLTITGGGSGALTSALVLSLTAWGIRALRGAALRGLLGDAQIVGSRFRFSLSGILKHMRRPRNAVSITPGAFKILVQEKPGPFVVFKVFRSRESAQQNDGEGGSNTDGPLWGEAFLAESPIFSQVEWLPERALKELLVQSGATNGTVPSSPNRGADPGGARILSASVDRSDKHELVVLVSNDSDEHVTYLTNVTCDHGYRSVYVRGGIKALEEMETGPDRHKAPSIFHLGHHAIMYLHTISQYRKVQKSLDAQGALSTKPSHSHGKGDGHAEAFIYDVRRQDERTMYGTIHGALHLPSDRFPHALNLKPDVWLDLFKHTKPACGDIVVLLCNSGLRSRWIAKLFMDAGYRHVFYNATGTNGWKIDPNLCAYEDYDLSSGTELPQPVFFEAEEVNFERGKHELESAGLLSLIM